MLVKKSSLGLQNPVTLAQENIDVLQCASVKLINAVTGGGEFSTSGNIRAVREYFSDGVESS